MITPSFSPTATERVLPKLALDFTTASLDSRVTFTRTTDATHPATYVNSNGVITSATNNQPRFDYTLNTGGTCKGLLIEESRTNLIPYSVPTSGQWGTYAAGTGAVAPVVTYNNAVAPDGTTTAAKVVHTATSTVQTSVVVCGSATLTAASYTTSIYLKGDVGGEVIYLMLEDNTTWTSKACTLTTSWQRFDVTGTRSASTNYMVIGGWGAFGGPTSSCTYYMWGAQVELGAFPTSYIPTTNTALTRNADVATMTGTNFSSWYNSSGGTIVAQVDSVKQQSSIYSSLFLLNTDSSNYFKVAVFPNGFSAFPEMLTAGASQINFMTMSVSGNSKIAAAFSTNNFKFSSNSTSPTTDTVVTIPSVNSLYLGCTSDGKSQFNGYLQKFSYYLPNFVASEMRAFTK